jgi:hypothetical protein
MPIGEETSQETMEGIGTEEPFIRPTETPELVRSCLEIYETRTNPGVEPSKTQPARQWGDVIGKESS